MLVQKTQIRCFQGSWNSSHVFPLLSLNIGSNNSRYSEDRIPPPSPRLLVLLFNLISLISTAALAQWAARSSCARLRSFPSVVISISCGSVGGGVGAFFFFYGEAVSSHGWLGERRLCVTFNEVKMLSESVCYQGDVGGGSSFQGLHYGFGRI